MAGAGPRILQVLSGRLGPAQARPSLPQGRGESGGYGGERGTRAALLQAVDPSKSCAQTFFSLLLSSAGLAIELERGRDLRTKYQAKCQLPFLAVPCAVGGSGFILTIGAQTFWTVLGHQSASPEPRGEAQSRPQTGTWHVAVRFALDGCFYFRGLREWGEQKCPFPASPGWAGGAGIGIGGVEAIGISQTDRCVGPRHSGEGTAHRAVGPGVTP